MRELAAWSLECKAAGSRNGRAFDQGSCAVIGSLYLFLCTRRLRRQRQTGRAYLDFSCYHTAVTGSDSESAIKIVNLGQVRTWQPDNDGYLV